MRLTEEQIQCIVKHAANVFGESVQVYLFGSRVYDHLKGGDIDLYIVARKSSATVENKIKYGARLEMSIGMRKIDIILATNPNRSIEQTALNEGILLNA